MYYSMKLEISFTLGNKIIGCFLKFLCFVKYLIFVVDIFGLKIQIYIYVAILEIIWS